MRAFLFAAMLAVSACGGRPYEPIVVQCEADADCRDRDPCTEDICGEEGICEHIPITSGACVVFPEYRAEDGMQSTGGSGVPPEWFPKPRNPAIPDLTPPPPRPMPPSLPDPPPGP